jgi:hypothetical protein
VFRERRTAKFWLQPFGLASNEGFASHEIYKIAKLIEANKSVILKAWNEHETQK